MGTINTISAAAVAAADKPPAPAPGSVLAPGGDGGGLFGTVLAVLAGEDASDQQQDTSPTSGDALQLALAAALLAAINPQNPETPPVGGAALPIADGKASVTMGAVAALAVEPATAQIAVGTVAPSVSQGRPVLTPAAPAEQAPVEQAPAVVTMTAMPADASPGQASAQRNGAQKGPQTQGNDTSSPSLSMPQEMQEILTADASNLSLGPHGTAAETNIALPQAKAGADGAAAETILTKPQGTVAPDGAAELQRAAPVSAEQAVGEQTSRNADGSSGVTAVTVEEEKRGATGATRQRVEPVTPAGPESMPFGGERLAAEFLPSPSPASHGPETVFSAPKDPQPLHDATTVVVGGPQRETIQLQLPPSDMGRVTMQVSLQARQVHAAVTVEHHGLGELLTAGQGSLDDAMKRHGLQVEEFRVDTFDTTAGRGGAWQYGQEPPGFHGRNDATPVRNADADAAGTATALPADVPADGAPLRLINLFA